MAGEPELSKGVSSEWAQYLQQLLQAAGAWSGNIDGEFGDDLEQAVMQYQSSQGLASDGVVRADTWNALTAGSGGSTGGGTTDDQTANLLELSDYPELEAMVNSETWEDYVRNVVGVDPADYQQDDEPVA